MISTYDYIKLNCYALISDSSFLSANLLPYLYSLPIFRNSLSPFSTSHTELKRDRMVSKVPPIQLCAILMFSEELQPDSFLLVYVRPKLIGSQFHTCHCCLTKLLWVRILSNYFKIELYIIRFIDYIIYIC